MRLVPGEILFNRLHYWYLLDERFHIHCSKQTLLFNNNNSSQHDCSSNQATEVLAEDMIGSQASAFSADDILQSPCEA